MYKELKNNVDVKLTYGRGYVYSIQYHIVWCTKYRRSVLVNEIASDLKKHLSDIAERYDFFIIAMEVMPDHVHMFIDCKPQFFPSDMIKIIKGNTARWLFMEHPELKKQLWGEHLWNPSYCIVTVSDRTCEIIKNYIDSQTKR